MKLLATLAAATILSGSMAFAALTTDTLIADLSAQGYTRIDARVGPTQIKVEAIKGNTKVETVYDIATGAVLDQETEQVDRDDTTTPGVRIRERDRDFVRVAGGRPAGDDDDSYDDDDRHDDDDDGYDDRDDDHHDGRDDDDDRDDDRDDDDRDDDDRDDDDRDDDRDDD